MDARAGIFAAAYELREQPELDEVSSDLLEELLEWFRQNLAIPQSFSRSGASKSSKETTRGLAWFKEDAARHLDKIWEMKALVELHGYQVEVLRTMQPGYIIFEDDQQIIADPFRDTPR